MKKIISIILISVLIISSFSVNLYAEEIKPNFETELIANKTTLNKGDTVEISVKIKNLTDVGEGINAFMGTFVYDTNIFETVTKSDMKAQNGWDAPEYNEENGKIITCKGEYITNDEIIFTINLKVKSDATFEKTVLEFISPEAANDNDYIGKESHLELEVVENPDGENPDGENPDGENPDGENPDGENPDGENPDGENPDGENPNNNNNNNTNSGTDNKKDDDTIAQGNLPKTGEKVSFIIISLIILSLIGSTSYILYKKNNI